MEDPRLSRMYLALMMRNVSRLWRRVWSWCTLHFGFVTLSGLVLLCCGLVIGWRAHERGRFALLKTQLKEGRPYQEAKSPQPGGQDAVVLQRTQISGGTMPEFLSATLLPGRGMNILQITAYLPTKGEVQLLEAPTLEDAAKEMTGAGADAGGKKSLSAGGPLELPWAGRITGSRSQDGEGVLAGWHGHTLSLPLEKEVGEGGTPQAVGGLLLDMASSLVNANVMPDGGESQATFAPGDFDKRWPSQTAVSTTVLLSRNVIEVKVLARNVGSEDEPMGIGWAPRFRILSDDRSQTLLKVPSSTRVEQRNDQDRLPTGRLVPVTGTPYDFTARGGARLGATPLDDTFVDLHSALFDVGPVVELRDPRSNFGLRLTAMTPFIKAIHIASPKGTNFISISEQSNFDDPLGKEWSNGVNPGLVTLHPGESVQWTVRLEIFPLSS